MSSSSNEDIYVESRDGTRSSLGEARGLGRILTDDTLRGYLIRHGLAVVAGSGELRIPVAKLTAALRKAADGLNSAPSEVRRHPALDMGGDLLKELAGAVASDAEADVVVPLGRRDHLRPLPDPPAPSEVLLAMEDVAPDGASKLLATLDAMLENGDSSLPADALRRNLIPLLTVEETCGLAARILGKAGIEAAVPAMRAALARTSSLDNRLELLAALMRLGHRALGLRTLRSILLHGSTEARTRAVDTLCEAATGPDCPAIFDMLPLVPPDERLRLATLLYQLGDARAYSVLAQALGSLDAYAHPELVERVLRAIDRIASRRFIPLLDAYREREDRTWFGARARDIARRLRANGLDELPPQDLLERAEEAYFSNNADQALERLREFIILEPDNPRALYLYANCLKEAGHLEEGLEYCEKALMADASHWRAHRLRGSLLWDLGRHERALEAYDRALALNPVDPYTWYYKGYVLYRLHRDAEALPCLDRALTLKEDSPYIYNQKAFCLERLGRHEEAVRCYRRSLQLKPGDIVIRDYLGQALQACGRLQDALECYEQVLRAVPDREETLYHRADVLYDMEEWSLSAEAFSVYLKRRSDSFNAWFNRGLCLRFLERFDEAIKCFKQALRLRPDSVNAKRQLAYCKER